MNYWPDVERRVHQAQGARSRSACASPVMASTGDDVDYINADGTGDLEVPPPAARADARRVVDLEGASRAAYPSPTWGSNRFRMDLVGYYRDNPDIDRLPRRHQRPWWRATSQGVIFVLRNGQQQDRPRRRRPPATVLRGSHEVRRLRNSTGTWNPRRCSTTCAFFAAAIPEPDMALCRAYNRETKNGRDMRRRRQGSCANAVASIRTQGASDIDSFFGGGTTSFFENDIRGARRLSSWCASWW